MRVARIAFLVLAAAAVLFFALAVWPTPYRYFELGLGTDRIPCRENRFTGAVDGFIPQRGGWAKLGK